MFSKSTISIFNWWGVRCWLCSQRKKELQKNLYLLWSGSDHRPRGWHRTRGWKKKLQYGITRGIRNEVRLICIHAIALSLNLSLFLFLFLSSPPSLSLSLSLSGSLFDSNVRIYWLWASQGCGSYNSPWQTLWVSPASTPSFRLYQPPFSRFQRT